MVGHGQAPPSSLNVPPVPLVDTTVEYRVRVRMAQAVSWAQQRSTDMEKLYDLKDKLCEELEEIARKPDMGPGDLELIHKLKRVKLGAGADGNEHRRIDGRGVRDGLGHHDTILLVVSVASGRQGWGGNGCGCNQGCGC